MKRGVGIGLGAVLVVLWWMRTSPELTDSPEPHRRQETRRTVFSREEPAASIEREAVQPVPMTNERLRYRQLLGDVVAAYGSAVVECELVDLETGTRAGRHRKIVDATEVSGTEEVQDTSGRTWQVVWELPQGETSVACSAELAEMFTLELRSENPAVPIAFCNGVVSMGRHEMPTSRTPCTLEGPGVRPVDIPQMSRGQLHIVWLEAEEGVPEDRSIEERAEGVFEGEDRLRDRAEKWREIVEDLRALRERTSDGPLRDLIDEDIARWEDELVDTEVVEERVLELNDLLLDDLEPQ